MANGEDIVITRHDKPVARIVREGMPRLDDVRRAVAGLQSLQAHIAARGRRRTEANARRIQALREK